MLANKTQADWIAILAAKSANVFYSQSFVPASYVVQATLFALQNIFCAHLVLVCTPHFKYDTENPYVTMEGSSHIHCWFNPDKTKTLILLAHCIRDHFEDETYKKIEQSSCPSCCFFYGGVTVISMQIEGTIYNRTAMNDKTTSEYLRVEESFNIKITFGSLEACVIL